jgi:hypothetical protein
MIPNQAANDFTAVCHVAVTRADLGKWMHVCAVFDGACWTMCDFSFPLCKYVTICSCTRTQYQSLLWPRVRASSGSPTGCLCSHPLIHDCASSHHACSEWAIGSKGGGGARLFIGHIADVQLWSVPLTRDHVASIVSDQAPPPPRPVARWMMDDDVGGKRAQVY